MTEDLALMQMRAAFKALSNTSGCSVSSHYLGVPGHKLLSLFTRVSLTSLVRAVLQICTKQVWSRGWKSEQVIFISLE